MKVFQKPDDFLDYAWAQISRGKADKKSPARHPTFVTSSADGFPNARTLVMRRSDRKNNQIEFHTDTASSKMFALKENPRAGIHIWLPKVQLQIQMDVVVEVKVGDITIPYWRMFQLTLGSLMELFLVLVKSLEAHLPMIMSQIRNVLPFWYVIYNQFSYCF